MNEPNVPDVPILGFAATILIGIVIVKCVLFLWSEPPQACTVIDLPPYEVQEIEDTGHHDNY